ncbi:substrate-binding domain-containing protein [Pseudomonas sp.]|uniref:substrate-binding domain-containing protein n=1 Tax=Pseudomonas sp. TaxID=306 RepID=UPI002733E3D7|nr:substrate-binding domain-containing protein [Pseudomonas sp.]MDP3816659.1 substrate-binding domain-containing protein [Pseudomonas sp.]
MRGRDRLCQALLLLALLASLSSPAWARDCIGVVPAGGDAFWQQVESGALQAGEELGVDIYYRGPQREGGVAVQLQVLERAVARGCKALVVAPTGKEVGERVSQLRASGIPTIYMDRDLAGGAALGLVATDNFAAGLRAGQHMVELLNGQGLVALLRLRRGVNSTDERERGFRQAAESGGLQLVIDTYVGDDSQLAMQALKPQLAQLDGLFTPNSNSSRAALAAMRRLGKAGQLVHIGFDGDEVLLEALRLGDLQALLIQQPQVIGYQAVKLAHQALRAGLSPAPVHMALEARLITRANMAELHEGLLEAPRKP